MFATLRLVNTHFWKTLYGPIFSLLFPSLLLIILGNILKIEYIYPGIIAMSGMFIGVLAMPLLLLEFKQSSLFKYIGTSSFSPWKFMLAIILYFLTVSMASMIFILLLTLAAFKNKVFTDDRSQGIFSGLKTAAGAFSFLISWFMNFTLAIAIGILLFTFNDSGQKVATFAFAIAIPCMFLSGMILSVDIIAQSEVMQWLSRLDLFRYTTGNLIVSSTPKNQVGDLFQNLTIDDKHKLFSITKGFDDADNQKVFLNIDNNTGHLLIQYFDALGQKQTKLEISTSKELISYMSNRKIADQVIPDYTLYRLIFIESSSALSSHNNIFSFAPWGVRRLPDVSILQNFVTKYFKGEDGVGGDKSRFEALWTDIKQNKYGWLNMFFKQNTTLYSVADKAANLFVPIIIPSIFVTIAIKKFRWKQ